MAGLKSSQSRVDIDRARAKISALKFVAEEQAVERLLQPVPYDEAVAEKISLKAEELVASARQDDSSASLLDTFMSEYGLSSAEGIALMCLAESLLRVPDQATANRLIADKVGLADWAAHSGNSDSHLVNVSTWGLMLTGKLVAVDREFTSDPREWILKLTNRISEPVVQAAMRSAMQILGREFVLGKTIEQALERSESDSPFSYDMLGEGARTAAAATQYQAAYAHAIETIGNRNKTGAEKPSSVSIKLSALHPRYEFAKRNRVMTELVATVRELCLAAAKNKIDLTIDAEEGDRLELSLDVFEVLAIDEALSQWSGLGIVVQAYNKRAPAVLDWLVALSRKTGRRFPVRLVKGAYWDAEIKHSQTVGYAGFPVYTRKAATDLAYLVCARYMLDHPTEICPQFATHNAHTIAAVMELAQGRCDIEFQRLHGMGESLYRAASSTYDVFPPVRTYAPVGGYDDLLAYLVRRLLENGANSSFVNRFLDKALPPAEVVRDPVAIVQKTPTAAHPGVPLPIDIFGSQRVNSNGIDLTSRETAVSIQQLCQTKPTDYLRASSLINGSASAGRGARIRNPADIDDVVGEWVTGSAQDIDRACEVAAQAQIDWSAQDGAARASALEEMARRLEQNREQFITLLCREAGKTIPDAVAEVREAIDFCRYYAMQGRLLFGEPDQLPGPTGEVNELSMHGRGVFLCISPWNFPLAIFLGQITAALVAGNTVVAKPSEETPLIAFEAVRLLHASGVPVNALQLILGDGAIGSLLVDNARVAGVAFTGSTSAAKSINLQLASRPGPIVPLIAETGGQNAMIIDSTALLEQVTDDVIQSAFLSAGQRCSSLRVLYLQEDIADAAVEMITGAMDELRVGHPSKLESDVGPIISESAAASLIKHIEIMEVRGRLLHRSTLSEDCVGGHFVAPVMIAIDDIEELTQEHFGPILHVIRFGQDDVKDVLESIIASGYGLTMGIHSRIESRVTRASKIAQVGNVYVNRNMIGAVVGSQPFGGQGLSGTGPKAGGPYYLYRFVTEKVISINTVATGGNAELLSLDDAESDDEGHSA
jgi:RHH-type proline utilization regulon transcriptional repressor/proline dehydrogenase/delta 1-pyrroline-5-carboxylate dehydrogenase